LIICSCNVLSEAQILAILQTEGAARPRSAGQAYRCLGCAPRGSVANLECGRREIDGYAESSCSEHVELLGQRGTGIEGVPRLVLAHHADHLDAT
jgi:hypothetical protein